MKTPLTFDNLINELDIDENGDNVVDEDSDDEFSFSENYLPKRKKRKLEEKKNVNQKPTQKSNSLECENCGSKFTRKVSIAHNVGKISRTKILCKPMYSFMRKHLVTIARIVRNISRINFPVCSHIQVL